MLSNSMKNQQKQVSNRAFDAFSVFQTKPNCNSSFSDLQMETLLSRLLYFLFLPIALIFISTLGKLWLLSPKNLHILFHVIGSMTVSGFIKYIVSKANVTLKEKKNNATDFQKKNLLCCKNRALDL